MHRRELARFLAGAAGVGGPPPPVPTQPRTGGAPEPHIADRAALPDPTTSRGTGGWIDVRQYGVVANDPEAAPENTRALRTLLDPRKRGPSGLLAFPNTTGEDVYHFNGVIPVRDGMHIDLMGCTVRYTGSVTNQDVNSGLFFALRDFSCENGTIAVACDTSAATSSGCAIQIGARGAASPYFTVWESLLPVPMGNIQLRNLRITVRNTGRNLSGSAGIGIFGGVENLIAENITIDGNGTLPSGIYYEFGWATNESAPDQRQTSHAHNMRFANIIVRNLNPAESTALVLAGAYGCLVDGLQVISAKNGFWAYPGESMFYRPRTGIEQLGVRSAIALRNIIVQAAGGKGVAFTGAQSGKGGYLAKLFGELGHPAEQVAETNLGDFSLEGFAISNTSGWGIMTSAGRARICNGRISGCESGIVATDECTSLSIDGVTILGCERQGMRLDLGGAFWKPARTKKVEIRNCHVCGNSTASSGKYAAIEIGANTDSALIESCRLGYESVYDGRGEMTQGSAVSAFDATNVLCRGNRVGGVAGSAAAAYSSAAAGPAAAHTNTVERATGLTTTAGNWVTDFQSASAQALGNDSSILTEAVRTVRVTASTAVRGVILGSGHSRGQLITIIHEGAPANTITFAAADTSHVADGAADSITGLSSRTYVWNAGNNLWYPSK
jgi:hypothetical protein